MLNLQFIAVKLELSRKCPIKQGLKVEKEEPKKKVLKTSKPCADCVVTVFFFLVGRAKRSPRNRI